MGARPVVGHPAHDSVQLRIDGALLTAVINNPPVNALGQDVRAGVLAAVERLESDDALHGMVVRAAGPVFIGGADIREFGGPRLEPVLSSVCDRIDACRKPIAVVIDGAALGGGLELALAAHYRVASPQSEVAFPEITLGVLPGAGGTQRAPRLAGAAFALDMMLSAARVSADAAKAAGLVDAVAPDAVAVAERWVRQQMTDPSSGPLPRARDGRALTNVTEALADIDKRGRELAPSQSGYFAARHIVACVRAAVICTPDEGLAFERSAFLTCLNSPQRAALVHVFFAERSAAKRRVDIERLGDALRVARDHAWSTQCERHDLREEAEACLVRAMQADARRLRATGLADDDSDLDVASIRFAGFRRDAGGVLWHAAHPTETSPLLTLP